MDKQTKKMTDHISEGIASTFIDEVLEQLKNQSVTIKQTRQELTQADRQLSETVNRLHNIGLSYEKFKEFGLEDRVSF